LTVDPTKRRATICFNDKRISEGKVDRRRFLAGSAAAATALAADPALADSYPSRTITIVNPFPPGGASDAMMRPLAATMETLVKQPVVIKTKPGASGEFGAQFVAGAEPDGYTLLSHVTSISGFAEVDHLFGRTPRFTRADFTPLARIVADPCALLVNDKQPYKNLSEFVEDAKKRPNEIAFSSSGLYGALHIPMALFLKAAGGLKLRHLPTNGGGPALTAFLGNNAQAMVSSISAARAQSVTGKARPLAMFGAQRSIALPEVPTMKELGYDIEYYLWVGLFAPKATPDKVSAYLRDAIGKAAHSKAFRAILVRLGQELAYLDGPDFAAFWDQDAARVKAAIKSIGRVPS
jgi:tripartite-type tricarboxylate transporter receptor subunit TctC